MKKQPIRPEVADRHMDTLDLLSNDTEKRMQLKKLVRVEPLSWEQTLSQDFGITQTRDLPGAQQSQAGA